MRPEINLASRMKDEIRVTLGTISAPSVNGSLITNSERKKLYNLYPSCHVMNNKSINQYPHNFLSPFDHSYSVIRSDVIYTATVRVARLFTKHDKNNLRECTSYFILKNLNLSLCLEFQLQSSFNFSLYK